MAFKVYLQNNYLNIEDTVSGKLYPQIAATYRIAQASTGSTTFDFPEIGTIDFAQILKQDGDPYDDVEAWIAFYTANTGKSSAGTGAAKQFVMYVGFQDSEGFTQTSVRINTIGIDFEFTRLNTGIFSISNFSLLTHKLETSINQSGYFAWAAGDEEGIFLTKSLDILTGFIASDAAFASGGWITITEIPTI